MKNIFLRTLLFIALKSAAYNVLFLLITWVVRDRIPAIAYGIAFGSIYAVMTFLFAERVYLGNRLKPWVLLLQIPFGYIVDALVCISFFSWYFGENIFLAQRVSTHVIYGLIFVISMFGGYVLKKRAVAMNGGVEGLA